MGAVGGAMVLGKLPVLGRSVNFNKGRARASALTVGAGWGCLDIIFSHVSLFFILPLSGRRPDID